MTKRKQDSKQLPLRALLKLNIPSLLIIYSLSDSHNRAFSHMQMTKQLG